MLQSPFFFLQNAVCFIMLPFFGSCIIHILHTDALILKKNSDAKGLRKQRLVLRNSIMKVGANWPITNCGLADKYTKCVQNFVIAINFENS
jgi:hypothetical protein